MHFFYTDITGGEKIKKSLIIICLILIFSINIAFAHDTNDTDTVQHDENNLLGNNISINGDSFQDIQSSIDGANNDDTVYLNGNNYNSTGSIINITKNISIYGSSQDDNSYSTLNGMDLSSIFNITGNYNVVLKNLIFEKVKLNVEGGVIYQKNGSLSLINCYFKDIDSSMQKNYAVILFMGSNSNLYIENVSIFNNKIASQDVIYGLFNLNENSICEVRNLNIYNNSFVRTGTSSYINNFGFIVSKNSKFNISGFNYYNNTLNIKGYCYGSLVYDAGQNSNISINYLNFHDNIFDIGDYAGLIYLSGSPFNAYFLNISNNVFTSKSIYGGVIYTSYSNQIIDLDNIIFSRNNFTATSNYLAGSLIAVDAGSGSVLTASNCQIFNNSFTALGSTNWAFISGGVVYCDIGSTIKLYNFTCYNLAFKARVSLSGGLMFAIKSNVYIDNISCENVSCYSYGFIKGCCIYSDSDSYSEVSNSSFSKTYSHSYKFEQLNELHGSVDIVGRGKITNCNFTSNSANQGIGIGLRVSPYYLNNPIVVENCIFINNSAYSSRTNYMDHGGAMCIAGAHGGAAIIRKSIFINNTNSQGGAMTPHNNCLVEDCVFINNTATKYFGGAISTYEGINENDNVNVTIRNCYFENNAAPIGGAIQANGDNVFIDNCTLKDNSAVQGGGVFLEGNTLRIFNSTFTDNNATHDLNSRGIITGGSYLPVSDWSAFGGAVYIHGNNSSLKNNSFKSNSAIHISDDVDEGKGGAIYIYGDFATVSNCHFNDNFAHSGNGSAVYISGNNSTFDLTEFLNHDSSRGTVYILGYYSKVLNSYFANNTASRGGAGIYCIGNFSIIQNSTFEKNNATIHGGAIHFHGNYLKILYSKFISNNAHPHDDELDYGLGGAIYTKGDYNDIAFSYFEFNTARNGSAIYNRGKNLTIEDCNFHFNRAYSYLLAIFLTPKVSNYSKNNSIVINLTHIGGDNIINAIYNDGNLSNIFFYNVTYEHSSVEGDKINSGLNHVNPVKIEDSNDGKLIYQDSREDLQLVKLIITRKSENDLLKSSSYDGDIIQEVYGRTGLYGNITFNLTGDLKPGNYNVYASHEDYNLYTHIENSSSFEILPSVDISITKSSEKDTYLVGDIATFIIKVTSQGTDAHNVTVNEILPDNFEIIDFNVTKGTYSNNIWAIGTLPQETSETLTIQVKLLKYGTFTNIVNVTTQDNDTNLTNNIANKTILVKDYVDLSISKSVNAKQFKLGDKIIWTISVKNLGTLNATNVKVIDKLPNSLKYISYKTTKGTYNSFSGEWNIGQLESGAEVTLTLQTKSLKSGLVINNAFVSCNESESNLTNNNVNATCNILNNTKQNGNESIKDNKTNYKNISKKFNQTSPKYISNKYETGNSILIIILAFMVLIVVVIIKKKN